MKCVVYADYYPVRILYKIKNDKVDLVGRKFTIDSEGLPERKFRKYWKWDDEKSKVVVDKAKVKAVNDKKDAEDAILAGIKTKLGLTDDEWEVLKKLVKR